MEQSPVTLFNMHVKHVGINCGNEQEARKVSEQFSRLLGLEPSRETEKAIFSAELTENMKVPGRGANGHIGFGVNDCEKAVAYFTERGTTLDRETMRFDENGKCIFVYFQEEIGGFAIHLIQD